MYCTVPKMMGDNDIIFTIGGLLLLPNSLSKKVNNASSPSSVSVFPSLLGKRAKADTRKQPASQHNDPKESLLLLPTTMDASPPQVRMPSIELNMSLLGSPCFSSTSKKNHAGEAAVQDAMTHAQVQAHPYEALLKEATKWVRDLEAVRDDLHMLSVKNAILLDSLAMAGATEGCL
jgi:hypothetical protein